MSLFSHNQVTLLGRVGRDPELRYSKAGKAVMSFSLATDRGGKDSPTDWHNITVWQPSDYLQEAIKKGTTLLVSGSLRYEQWEDRDGNKRYRAVVVAHSVTLVNTNGNGSKASSTNASKPAATKPAPEPEPEPALDPDDIPF